MKNTALRFSISLKPKFVASALFTSFLLQFVLVGVTKVEAAPLRSANSSELFLAYNNPQEATDGYSDKFYISKPSATKTYTVAYQTDDPILFISLQGGRITNFERTASSASVTFSTEASSTDEEPLYLHLFSDARITLALNEVGFKDALSGAYFSSEAGSVVSRPVFFDEPLNPADSGTEESLSFSVYYKKDLLSPASDTVYAFFPSSALSFINKASVPSPDKILVRRYSGEAFDSAIRSRVLNETSNGVEFKIPVPHNASAYFSAIAFTVVNTTNFYAPQSPVSPRSKLTLSAYVENCEATQKVRFFESTGNKGKTHSLGAKKLTGCVATLKVTPKKTTRYKFIYKENEYQRIVKVK